MKRFYGNFDPTITVYEVIQTLDDRIEKLNKRIDLLDTALYIAECNDLEGYMSVEDYEEDIARLDRLQDMVSKSYEVCEVLVRTCNKIETARDN